MPDDIFHLEEQKLLTKVSSAYYMAPVLKRLRMFIEKKKNKKQAWKEAFNHIHDFLTESEHDVRNILQKRQKEGRIRDISQAMKRIAGHAFSHIVVFLFLQNKKRNMVAENIFITDNVKKPSFKDIATIHISGQMQKPDIDIIVFKRLAGNQIGRCLFLSLKTSLRERAGQTYKWKLLLEIATTDNPIKTKYHITYNKRNSIPLMCFATTNFYDEIHAPQQKGMLAFFDKTFIAKPIEEKPLIAPLAEFITFVNENLT